MKTLLITLLLSISIFGQSELLLLMDDDNPMFATSGIPLEYSINPLGIRISMTRSVIEVNDTLHYFEENTGSNPVNWWITKRTSTDGIHFTASSDTLIEVSGGGTYDDKGTADPTVIYDGVGDWKMWFDALSSSSTWDSIGYGTSTDGLTWTNEGGVIGKGSSGAWDGNAVHHPVCIKYNGTYYLYYSGSKDTSNGNGVVGEIGLATSTDGLTFTKEASNPVLNRGAYGSWDGGYLRPSAPQLINGIWYMWYWGYSNTTTKHATGLATSTDLINWTKQGIVLDRNGSGSTATTFVLKEGTDTRDKILQMWFTVYPGDTAMFATVSSPLPEGATKIDNFTTTPDISYGDFVEGAPTNVRSPNYIHFFKVSVTDNITPDAIKMNIGAYISIGQYTTGKIRIAIYSDSSGTPKNLLNTSTEKDWASVQLNTWNDFALDSAVALSSGSYWLGVWSSAQYKKTLGAGGTNNLGSFSAAYTGTFPVSVTVDASYGYNDIDMIIMDTKANVWQTTLASEPTAVYFNSILGNKKTSVAGCTTQFDWYWASNVLYIYSTENPDVRYQISYK